jgi:hypothetical protein
MLSYPNPIIALIDDIAHPAPTSPVHRYDYIKLATQEAICPDEANGIAETY